MGNKSRSGNHRDNGNNGRNGNISFLEPVMGGRFNTRPFAEESRAIETAEDINFEEGFSASNLEKYPVDFLDALLKKFRLIYASNPTKLQEQEYLLNILGATLLEHEYGSKQELKEGEREVYDKVEKADVKLHCGILNGNGPLIVTAETDIPLRTNIYEIEELLEDPDRTLAGLSQGMKNSGFDTVVCTTGMELNFTCPQKKMPKNVDTAGKIATLYELPDEVTIHKFLQITFATFGTQLPTFPDIMNISVNDPEFLTKFPTFTVLDDNFTKIRMCGDTEETTCGNCRVKTDCFWA
ncbi:hypothetical protein KA001_01230 [Patescibacteria group bacterium]|nr:hypothetical protein [Patescibacteria group bacterium]